MIATGVAARYPEGVAGAGRSCLLRTLDDAIVLRGELEGSSRVVVIGVGVLASESASAARAVGREAVIVGRSGRLSFGTAGSLLSPRLEELHITHGVELELSVGAREVLSIGEHATGVVLNDGRTIEGDLVIGASGDAPRTGWLAGSALQVDDGELCSTSGRAADGVFAVGDVARWVDEARGGTKRVEHQSNAIEQGLAVARTIVTGKASAVAAPFFWFDIQDVRIQAYGTFDRSLPLRSVVGDPASDRFVLGSIVEGRALGILGWNVARDLRLARSLVDDDRAAVVEVGSLLVQKRLIATPRPTRKEQSDDRYSPMPIQRPAVTAR